MQGYRLEPELIREILKALADGRMPQSDLPELVLRNHYRVLFHEGLIMSTVPDIQMGPDRFIMYDTSLEKLFQPLDGNDNWFFLSFGGNDFLQNILNDSVWNEAQTIMKKIGSGSLQIVVSAAADVLAAKIKEVTGLT